MPCTKPLRAAKTKKGVMILGRERVTPTGAEPMRLPCGQCTACRLRYSREWAIRAVHESQLHSRSCFVTLTYSDQTVPLDGSLSKRDFQLFMKRLRKKFPAYRIRHLLVGEYGEKTQRPHGHALLWNVPLDDLEMWKSGTNPLYTSKTMEKIWGHGYAPIGNVTFDSAAYVARYAMKKVNGKNKEKHYRRSVPGTSWNVEPEFSMASNRKGIGRDWLYRYWREVYPRDYVVFKGRKFPPPRRYDAYIANWHPLLWQEVQERRRERAETSTDEWTLDRLAAHAQVVERQLSEFKRYVE